MTTKAEKIKKEIESYFEGWQLKFNKLNDILPYPKG